MVNSEKRFQSIKVTYPIRGHSYLECDGDMSHVPQSKRTEHPKDWENAIKSCRRNPSPYNVITLPQESYKGFTKFLNQDYRITSPICSRPIREMKFEENQPRFLLYKCAWGGNFLTTDVFTKRKSRKNEKSALQSSYSELLPISEAKFKDLQVLKQFCSPENRAFYEQLPSTIHADDNDTDYF